MNIRDRHRESIIEAAAGQKAFLRLVAAHHQRCLYDPMLHHPFSHLGNSPHSERLAAYWAEVRGGPPADTHRAGGHSFMRGLHARTQADDDLGICCVVGAFDDADLPDDDALHCRRPWTGPCERS